MAAISAKLDAVRGTPFRFYNANVETLLPSLRAGANGFSGISANFYPHLHAWLCRAARDEAGEADAAAAEDEEARRAKAARVGAQPLSRAQAMRRVQDFLSLAEATVCVRYPQSAKVYLRELLGEDLMSASCRHRPDGTPMAEEPWLEHQVEALRAMRRVQQALCDELKASGLWE